MEILFDCNILEEEKDFNDESYIFLDVNYFGNEIIYDLFKSSYFENEFIDIYQTYPTIPYLPKEKICTDQEQKCNDLDLEVKKNIVFFPINAPHLSDIKICGLDECCNILEGNSKKLYCSPYHKNRYLIILFLFIN
jgi:hypothetical protein